MISNRRGVMKCFEFILTLKRLGLVSNGWMIERYSIAGLEKVVWTK